MTKVLFIIPDNYQNDNTFPLGIGYLAAVLAKENITVEIYCMDVYHYSNQELVKHLEKHSYDLIGFGFLAARFKETIIDLSKIVSDNKKHAKFVIGGHGVTPIPEYMLKSTNADIAILGEGEETITELMKDKSLDSILGIAYRENNQIKINPRRKPTKDLNLIPFPLWNAFPMEKYVNSIKFINWKITDKSFPIITSRGCINHCGFCYRMEKGIRFRSIDNIIEEIIELHNQYGINYFRMQDECFILTEKRLKDFITKTKNLNFDFKYSCDCIVNKFTKNIARLLKDSGCIFVNFGFESMDLKVLNLMNKHINPNDNIKAAELAKKVAIPFGLNFIWNCPGDTEKTLTENAEFIKKYDSHSQIRTIRPMTPYPGSSFYYDAISRNLLKNEKDFFERFKNSDLITVNFMDLDEEEAYKLLLKINSDLITNFAVYSKEKINAKMIIKSLQKLYFKKNSEFRGLRHYI